MTLYLLTNRISGRSYVGATTRRLNLRMSDHRAQAKRGLTHPLSVAIREYGWSVFTVAVLGTFATAPELYAAERATITALGTLFPAGYNRAEGGLGTTGVNHTDEIKAKIRAKAVGRKGVVPWNKGMTTPPEVIQKRVAKLRGHKPWNKGIPATEHHRAALRASHAGKVNPASRRVEFDGQEFPTIRAAAAALGLSPMQAKYRLRMGRAKYL